MSLMGSWDTLETWQAQHTLQPQAIQSRSNSMRMLARLASAVCAGAGIELDVTAPKGAPAWYPECPGLMNMHTLKSADAAYVFNSVRS